MPTAGVVVNIVAWVVLLGLAVAAMTVAALLGPFGVALLGLLVLLVCTQVSLDEDAPGWGVEVFRSRMTSQAGPEQRAAAAVQRRATGDTLRYARRCAVLLIVAGACGLAWQHWQ